MAKGANQKLKLLYLMQLLLEKKDEFHSITMAEILRHLRAYDIEADRRTKYEDIHLLQEQEKMDVPD